MECKWNENGSTDGTKEYRLSKHFAWKWREIRDQNWEVVVDWKIIPHLQIKVDAF